MSDISTLMDVYNAENISDPVKCRMIIKLGRAINDSNGMNLTQELVYELIKNIDPAHEIMTDQHYLRFVRD